MYDYYRKSAETCGAGTGNSYEKGRIYAELAKAAAAMKQAAAIERFTDVVSKMADRTPDLAEEVSDGLTRLGYKLSAIVGKLRK